VLVTASDRNVAALRRKLMRLAGSCPDFPPREPHTAPDIPRDLNW
jgi:hypothetical protein